MVWSQLATVLTAAAFSTAAFGSSIALHLHPSSSAAAASKEISWDQATSILSHVNGVSKYLRGGLILNDESDETRTEVLSVLDDERVRKISGSLFDQPEASLVVVVKGVKADAVPVPVSFRISEDSTSSAMVSEYVTDFTELIADAHPSGDMLLSVSSEAQNPTIAGVSRVTLGERSALMSIPDDAPEKVKVTLNEIASSAYESVSDHVVEKFGEEARLFSQDDKIDRMFLIEVDFVTSLFDALRIQRIHQLRKRTLTTGKLPDFIGITLTGANNLRAKYGEDSKEYKAGVSITTKVLKQITDAFSTMYEKGVAEIISVGPETALEGQVPNLVKRLASINIGCPQAVSDCQTAFNNCSNHGVCTNFVNPRNRNETCFFCSCFKNNTDDSGTVLLNKNRRKVIWAGPSCAAQDISSQFNILLWTIIAFVIAIIFVIGLMYSIGEEAASSGASGVAKRRKQD